ncbi:MAG: hypothetical protein L6R41_003646 [Letrouitia leprolyta]|nr:MAG: hypothetical protein L6R41_003646 [Letrouitia leprolyta]
MPPTTVTFTRRAVSPVQFESLEADADDILCPGSDAEETLAERRKKKRRVEEAAQEYLRGRGLYIASARLRGPFPDDWRNPYVKKRRRSKVSDHASPRWQNSYKPGQSQTVAPQTQDSAQRTYEQESDIGKDMTPSRPHHEQVVKQMGQTPSSRIRATIAEEDKATQDSFVTATSEPSNETNPAKIFEASSSGARGWLKTDGRSTRRQFREGPRSPSPTPASRPRNLSPRQIKNHGPKAAAKQRDHDKQPAALDIEGDHLELRDLTNMLLSKPDATTESLDPNQDGESPQKASFPPTDLPGAGFAYRYGPRNAAHSPNREFLESELKEMKAAKKRARVEEKKKRLSFTASGNVKRRPSNARSRGSQPSQSRHAKPPSQLQQSEMAEEPHIAYGNSDSRPKPPTDEGSNSNDMGALPEAQIVQLAGLSNDRSVPSVELLETEKQSLKFRSTDEGDLFHGLSTQAAMLQAQRSLQQDMDSPFVLADSDRGGNDHAITKQVRSNFGDEDDHQSAGTPRQQLISPAPNEDEPISTQAMFDAVSPFVLTTVKKPGRDERQFDLVDSIGSSPPQSPTVHDFRLNSLSMSTTPPDTPCPTNNELPIPLSALSKPTSTITSFSIAPNGTMTELMQYDGQQQQPYNMGDSDLDAAIEEAGSFLGDWSVEKEAKQLERATAESRKSTV